MKSSASVHIDRNAVSRVLARYRMGDRMAVDAYIRDTLKMTPDQVQAKCCLAALALETGDLDAAGKLLEESGEQSLSAEVCYLKGRLAEMRGDMVKARSYLDQALEQRPEYAGALYGMGRVVQRSGKPAEAAAYYRKALRIYPQFADAAYNLGKVLSVQGRLSEALDAFTQAVAVDPRMIKAHTGMASTLRDLGESEAAQACLRAAMDMSNDPLLKIRHCLTMPVICPSEGAIGDIHRKIEQELDLILAGRPRCKDPFTTLGSTGFYLAYHGRDNRVLQAKLAAAYRTAAPQLVWRPSGAAMRRRPKERIRVVIVSRHMRRHTIGYLNAGIVEHLSRSAFEVIVGRFEDQAGDDVAAAVDRSADRVVRLSPRIPEARQQLAALKPDVIYYPDIGMDPVTYFLAFSRLAPVQCTSWGHPDTTGISNLDYYVSNRLAEPVGAQAHYTERLVCLSRFPMYLPKPSPAPVRERQDFRLPTDRRVYLCPQSLFKLHPDFDALVEGILRQDREGVLVLFHGKHPRWRDLLLKRMARHMPDLVERILFFQRVPEADFPSVLRLADAVIDSPHFTGGYTSLIAFSQGVPVVTLPGNFMRSRLTYALYRQMGLAEMVAVDAKAYVALALRLANDRDFYRHISHRIRERAGLLYDDLTAVRELGSFFVQAVEGKR